MDAGTNGAMACRGKGKVVVVMGATATGKSKLAVDLALRFGGEVVNSDKIQVHDGLSTVTNKVTAEECRGVPHYLIGVASPDADYTAADFCRDATRAVGSVHASGRVPIIAGGSNRYLEALMEDDSETAAFRQRYECCFLWIDADLPVLDRYIRDRVDCMLEHGLVDEVRGFFRPDADYSLGIRRAIGVPEMDTYFRFEAAGELDGDDDLRARLLSVAVEEIKANTCGLARCQLQKIRRLRGVSRWSLRRLDATAVLELKASITPKDPEAERAAWEEHVAGPAARAVATFLDRNGKTTTDGIAGFVAAASKEVAMAGAATKAECCGAASSLRRQRWRRAVRARVYLGMKAAAAAV